MKIGLEVEGSFQGAVTIFIGVNELDTLLNIVSTSAPAYFSEEDSARYQSIQRNKPESIYISDLENTLDYADTRLHDLAVEYEVTLEVTSVKEGKPGYLNLMYHVQDSEIWKALSRMRDTDQIKFSEGLNVLATAKLNLVETKPEAFQHDVVI